jgi:hypothetical protein
MAGSRHRRSSGSPPEEAGTTTPVSASWSMTPSASSVVTSPARSASGPEAD